MKKKINIGVVGLGNVGSYFCNEVLKKSPPLGRYFYKNISTFYTLESIFFCLPLRLKC